MFAVDVADFNHRSRRAFLRCGSCRKGLPSPPGAPTAFVHDLVCRPALLGAPLVRGGSGQGPIWAGDPRYGAAFVVYRRAPRLQVLVLHRAGARTDGDWAWTPRGPAYPRNPSSTAPAGAPRRGWPRPKGSSGDSARRRGLGGLRVEVAPETSSSSTRSTTASSGCTRRRRSHAAPPASTAAASPPPSAPSSEWRGRTSLCVHQTRMGI